ncbi:hypothetical protein L3Q82_006551 [Scortum barcoo]|uniref:Uncharacterized protein n=1 Tax=Scortum barcoo TaxID=214431 RepID=A0ACB8WYX4_9TELE|nr:hypothetical protein L3Q82_006551 [Scortum barcoo]
MKAAAQEAAAAAAAPAAATGNDGEVSSLDGNIHPSIHLHPLGPGPGRGGSSLSRDAQTSLTPDTSSSSSGDGPRGVPRPAERHSLSSVSWVFPWASSRWDTPGTPP